MVKNSAATSLEWKDIWILILTYSELIKALNNMNSSNAKQLKKLLNELIEVRVQASKPLRTRNTLDDLQRYLSTDNPIFKGINTLGRREDFAIAEVIDGLMTTSVTNQLTVTQQQLVSDLTKTLSDELEESDANKIREQVIAVNRSVAQYALLLISDIKAKSKTIESWNVGFLALKSEIEKQVRAANKKADASSSLSSSSASTSSFNTLSAEQRARSGNVFSWDEIPFLSQSSPDLVEESKKYDPVTRVGSAPDLSPTKAGKTLKRTGAVKYDLAQLPLLNLKPAFDSASVSPLAPRPSTSGSDSLGSSVSPPIAKKKKEKSTSAPTTPTAEDGYEAERDEAAASFGLFAKSSAKSKRLSSPQSPVPRGRKKS